MSVEDLTKKAREMEALVGYLRAQTDEKDGRIAKLESDLAASLAQSQASIEQVRKLTEIQTKQLIQELEDATKKLTELSQENLGLLSNKKENILLRQQLQEIQNELQNVRKQHVEELRQVRDETTIVRASLAGEFHLQLQQQLVEKTAESLSQLPEKARTALAEREYLKCQLSNHELQLQKLLEENKSIDRVNTDLKLQIENMKLESQALGDRNFKLRQENSELRKQNQFLQVQFGDAKPELEAYKSQRSQIERLQDERAGALDQSELLNRQLQAALFGLRRVCGRHNYKIDQFYRDPTLKQETIRDVPSILAQPGRFVVPSFE